MGIPKEQKQDYRTDILMVVLSLFIVIPAVLESGALFFIGVFGSPFWDGSRLIWAFGFVSAEAAIVGLSISSFALWGKGRTWSSVSLLVFLWAPIVWMLI